MSQTKQIAHNTFAQIAGKAISTILGLVAIAIMTRSLGVEQFGWYATAIGFLQFIGILSDFGFTVTSAKMLSEPAFDKKKLLNNLFTWRFVTTIIFQGIGPLTILLFPYPPQIKLAVAILSISYISASLNQIFIAFYQTRLQTHIQAIAEVISRMVLVTGIALMSVGHLGFLPIMGAVALAAFFNTGYLWWKSEPIRLQTNKDITFAILKKIWPTALAVIFNCIYLQGDRFILPLFVSQTDVGFYGAAYRVLDIAIQVAAMIMGIMMPLITFGWSRNLKPEFEKQCQRSFDLMSLLLIPMIAGIFVLAVPLMNFIAGENFAISGNILRILIISVIGVSFGMVFGHMALSIDRQKNALWIYITDAILSLAGYLIFIPRYGIYGAAYVTIFSELYAGFFLAWLVIHYSGFRPQLFTLFKILISSLVMALVVYWLQPLNIILSIFVGTFIYAILAIVLRFFSPQTLKEIFSSNKNKIAENRQN
ncbi:MAG: hypothetical protein COU29_02440 [Candidatus Magasanikbacteria bacterium CG10_big_fil_rev_8_21_14_0_10_36_32]|uniref:Uncharacterized protein n=1 Tax=Candidatus Magasanikbacteria bacterium CG10_big_fil_rev_8_21_14_0_10_36_32 TaxID=1974646 RepID=A0A2M6W729_9BACT|nr:MAG: hypothetical protein COU29_02440 [Candidatus Magasanikbacteria bacterium CG10_big_fil_rev_8_21_14_0_10_36_32]